MRKVGQHSAAQAAWPAVAGRPDVQDLLQDQSRAVKEVFGPAALHGYHPQHETIRCVKHREDIGVGRGIGELVSALNVRRRRGESDACPPSP